ILAPDNWSARKEVMRRAIDEVRRLWRGEAVTRRAPDGSAVAVCPLPRPVPANLPGWGTAAGNLETFGLAGGGGASVLTHLLGQDLDELREKIAEYRRLWRACGHQGAGHVTLMLHTYVGADAAGTRELVRAPLRQYLSSSLDLARGLARAVEFEA